METEIWPNLIHACRRRSVPLYLVNARLSARSWAGYRRVAGFTRRSLAGITAIAAQSEQDAERFTALGAKNVVVTGSVKFDVTPPAEQVDLAQALRRLYGEGRRVLLAASTREGEEELILDELDNIKVPALLTVIVPRHPRRFDAVAGLIAQRGFRLQRRSAEAPIAPDTRVVLGDSDGGDVRLLRRVRCRVHRRQPAAVRRAQPHRGVRHGQAGPDRSVRLQLSGARALGGSRPALRSRSRTRVRSPREASRLLLDPESARRMGEAGAAFCATHRGATARIMELIRGQQR